MENNKQRGKRLNSLLLYFCWVIALNKVAFEVEKKTSLGEVKCPKCGHAFEHVKTERIPVSYEVKANIQNDKSHPKDRTNVQVQSKPFEVLCYQAVRFLPKSADELKQTIKMFMKKYKAKAWIFGLGGDKIREVTEVEQVDKEVDDALVFMKKHGYTPKFS